MIDPLLSDDELAELQRLSPSFAADYVTFFKAARTTYRLVSERAQRYRGYLERAGGTRASDLETIGGMLKELRGEK